MNASVTKLIFSFIGPDAGPVESIDIFGFSTEELYVALTMKAQKSAKNWCVDVGEQIPGLLKQLHDEMANNVTHVS